ncbi:hypothetical protein JCM14469_26700 [Desulfatiferula olefinivorans]
MKFLEKMAEYSLYPGEIKDLGRIQRFPVDGRNLDGWLFYNQTDGASYGCFGDWSTGLYVKFTDFGEGKTAQEIEAVKAEFEKIKADCELIRQQESMAASEKAEKIWNESQESTHEYLERKKVLPLGTRVYRDSLIVPVRKNHKIMSLQFIGPDKSKKFLSNGTTKGGAFYIPGCKEIFVICEGFSTGASIHMATGFSVVVAFYAGNLTPVAISLREALPKAKIVIACDNDQYKDINTGVRYGTEAANAIGAKIAIPEFKSTSTNPTDFNDLHILEGLEMVKTQLSGKENTLYDDVKEWCCRHTGEFMFSEIVSHFGYREKSQKDALDKAIQRLKKENIVKGHETKRNTFRVVETEEQQIDITKNIKINPLNIKLPFGLHRYVVMQPKNIIVIAGESNAGKTAIMLENMRENIIESEFQNPLYISSEMGESEFKMRVVGIDPDLEMWSKAEIIDKSDNFQDVISNGRKNKLVYIDYLEPPSDAGYAGIENSIKSIRDALDKGVSMIALQKTKGKDTARGGDGTLAKARLYLSLHHCYQGIYGTVNRCKIEKCKMVKEGFNNPTGKTIFYSITKGGGIRIESNWGYIKNLDLEITRMKEINPEASDSDPILFNNEQYSGEF